MPLVKSPRMTPAKLAANRANAQKSTGPRTPESKRRVMLNALKHGRDARTEKLVQGGADADLFAWIRSQVAACYEPHGEPGQRAVERLAREVWCSFWPGPQGRQREIKKRRRLPSHISLWSMQWVPWRRGGLETMPRYAVKSVDSSVTPPFPLRVRVRHERDPRQLVFWVRARRDTVTLSLNRLVRMAEKAMEGHTDPGFGVRDGHPEQTQRARLRPAETPITDRRYRDGGLRYENSGGLWAKLARLAAQAFG